MNQELQERIKHVLPSVIALRHALHKIPELKYQEFKTAKLITQTLIAHGYKPQTKVAGTGIVATLDTGKPGKTIALRADMDALPLTEPKGLAYRSQHEGCMHACGHDGHCATVLGVAILCQQLRPQLTGKIKFIFQPAEEGGKGSTKMIEAGVLDNPPVDAIYGYHNWPGLPKGCVASKTGAILVGNGRFSITIKGKPQHSANLSPQASSLTVGALFIQEIAKFNQSYTHDAFNCLSFQSASLEKYMDNTVEIIGVYYVESEHALNRFKQLLGKLTLQATEKKAFDLQTQITAFHCPTVNHDKPTEHVFKIANQLLGSDKIEVLAKPQLASEDFSEYAKHVPASFFLVGTGRDAARVHTQDYQFEDDILEVAITMFIMLCQTQ